MNRFILFFNFGSKLIEYPLYDAEDRHIEIPLYKYGVQGVLSLEVWGNQWILLEDENITLFVNKHQVPEVQMQDNIVVACRCGGVQFSILIRAVTPTLTIFNKYITTGVSEITLGSSNLSTIYFRNNFVAPTHFTLVKNDTKWYVKPAGDNTAVFLNSMRVTGVSPALNVGDIVMFADIKLICLGDIIALNHVDEFVSRLPVLSSTSVPDVEVNYLCEEKFSRIPRMMEPFDDEDVSIEQPPSKARPDETPWIFTIGPAVTMPMPMLISMFWRMQGSNGAMGSMFPAMLISMMGSMLLGLFWNTMRKNYQKKKMAKDEAWRVECYTKYLDKNRALLEEKKQHNASLMLSQYPSCFDLFQPQNFKDIWNRNTNHQDFLTIRLGTGCIETPNKINVSEERFSLYSDDLEEIPRKIRDEYEYLTGVPSLVDLNKNRIVGIIGKEANVHTLVRTILTQITGLHCYNDINLSFFYDENDGVNYDWVRWYPHTFIKDKSLRLVASNRDNINNVMGYVQSVLRNRAEAMEDEGATVSKLPHQVVVFTSDKMLDTSALSKYFDPKYQIGVTFILAFSDISMLPNECNAIIQADDNYMGFYNLDATRDEPNKINFEVVSEANAVWFARKLMSINLKELGGSGGGSIPNYVDFCGLLRIGDLNNYPLEKRYRENRAYESIKAVMGIGEGGKEQILDLHEKKFGPHGLVAGTTGSGKSETLQTIILSWMMNYSPDEVAFVLIDYKGGGMANAFIGAPHLAGTITNISDGDDEDEDEGTTDSLDQNQTRRALIAIKSEIKRRQRMFKAQNVNHVDQYMRLYRKGVVSEPLPHLIMISDEFAELKQQQPEFIKELVSAARVGRSLGVHLILATQKPSNSVDDEIWANSRFKICLRVQDKADSNGMLHRPEAAFLTKTGRGYFQLGNDEIFEEFQSGYSGATYEPTDVVETPEDIECRMIELDGTDTYIEREHKEKREDSVSQLAACVKFITDTSERLGYKPARQLWAPQLRRKMFLPDVMQYCASIGLPFSKSVLGVCGLIDDPEQQDQYPLYFDLLNINNVLVYGQATSGKSTLIKTLITSLCSMYSPEQFQFYAFDFSSRTLKMFKKLPHCGDVIFEDDEEEYITRLFQLLLGIVEERKRLFADANIGSISDYLAIKQLPVITLFIDNIYPFKQNSFEKYASALETLVRSSKYGIQVIATISKENEMAGRLRQNFLTSICLSLPERTDYRFALGTPVTFTPSPYKGRGMCTNNGRALEFHTALPVRGTTEIERTQNLIQYIDEIAASVTSKVVARPVPIIPKDEVYKDFYNKFNVDTNLIPIGYNTGNISPVYFDMYNMPCLTLSDGIAGMLSVATCMRNMIYACQQQGHEVYYLQFRPNVRIPGVKIDNVYKSNQDYKELLPKLNDKFAKRATMVNTWRKANPDSADNFAQYLDEILPKEHIVVFVDNMLDFFNFCTSMDNAVKPYNQGYKDCFMSYLSGAAHYYRVHFVMGLSTNEFGTASQNVLGRAFMSYRNGIHFGGNLSSVTSFDSNLDYKAKGLIKDKNKGNTVIDGADVELVMPMELE